MRRWKAPGDDRAKGYQVGEAEVVAALEVSKQSALADQQLDGVVGGVTIPEGVAEKQAEVSAMLKALRDDASPNVNIVDMFEMQMNMNKLSQLSEMSTGVVSASNSAIGSMARNVKS